jgi:hypothetical protein
MWDTTQLTQINPQTMNCTECGATRTSIEVPMRMVWN